MKNKEISPAQVKNDFDRLEQDMRSKIKAVFAARDCEVKGSAGGHALSKMLDVLDEATGENIMREVRDYRRKAAKCADVYVSLAIEAVQKGQEKIERLHAEICKLSMELEKKQEELDAIDDETVRNAVQLYRAIASTSSWRYNRGPEDARDIALAYINSVGDPNCNEKATALFLGLVEKDDESNAASLENI